MMAPATLEKYAIILRITDIIERDPYATAEAMALQSRLPPGVSVLPGTEVPGRQSIAITQPIAMINTENGEISDPSLPAKPGADAHSLEDASVIRRIYGLTEKEGLIFGTEIYSKIDIPLSIRSISRHYLILGTTGSGKSWLRGKQLEVFNDLGIPQIIFDINGEYIKATEELHGCVLVPGINFTIKLSSIPDKVFENMITSFLPTEWQQAIAIRAFRIFKERRSNRSARQQSLLEREAARRGFSEANEYLNCITIAGEELEARADSVQYVRARMEVWLREMSRIIGEGVNWTDLFMKHKVITVNCEDLNEWEMELIVSATCKQLLDMRVERRIPPFVLTIDEAHRFIPRERSDKSATAFIIRDLIRRGRHHAIGVIIITQYPDSIDKEVLRIPCTKFIFAIEPGHLREMETIIRDLPKGLINSLPSLPVGVCVLTGTRDVVSRSMIMKVSSDRKTTHGGITPDIMKELEEFYGTRR
jgi:DNA helicase HerA-like ATPase